MILLDYLGRSTVIARALIKERREVSKKVGDRERERCYGRSRGQSNEEPRTVGSPSEV